VAELARTRTVQVRVPKGVVVRLHSGAPGWAGCMTPMRAPVAPPSERDDPTSCTTVGIFPRVSDSESAVAIDHRGDGASTPPRTDCASCNSSAGDGDAGILCN